MRLHIELADRLVAEVDEIAGPRGRSAFVRDAIAQAVGQARRWEDIRAAAGTISDEGHEWDDDPAAWVRSQRFADDRRTG